MSAELAADDRELLRRARGGDEEAFEQIVAGHAERVYGVLRRFGLSPGDAEEVAQEVFLRAWRGLKQFEGRAQLSTWLYRIAFNEAQRRVAQARGRSAHVEAIDADEIAAIAAPAQEGPPAQALDREFVAALERALAQIAPDLRVAVVLRDLEGLSTKEAASAAGVREAAFKSRLHRGRMQLRELLGPYL